MPALSGGLLCKPTCWGTGCHVSTLPPPLPRLAGSAGGAATTTAMAIRGTDEADARCLLSRLIVCETAASTSTSSAR
jgi:hypothetical protein